MGCAYRLVVPFRCCVHDWSGGLVLKHGELRTGWEGRRGCGRFAMRRFCRGRGGILKIAMGWLGEEEVLSCCRYFLGDVVVRQTPVSTRIGEISIGKLECCCRAAVQAAMHPAPQQFSSE